MTLGVLAISAVHSASSLYAQTTSRPSDGTASQPATSKAGTRSELDSIDLLTLDIPTVVTAGRREQKITNVPYAITVITAEDIRAAGARTIPDALRLAPGMDVAELAYGNAAVAPRGMTSLLAREVLVMVDGRQLFDSLYAGTLWGAWPFQLEDIDRIEVIRGPGGVTWGANAVNGVINIITKDPKDQKGLTITGGGGSRGMNKEHVGYAFEDKKLRMRISGEYEGSDGFKDGGSFLQALDDGCKTGRTGLHAIYDANPNDKLTLSAGNAIVSEGFPPPPTFSFLRDRQMSEHSEFILGRWDHAVEKDNSFTVTSYFNDFYSTPASYAIEYRYQQYALQFSHTFKPAENHTLTWGIDTRADYLDTSHADPFLLTQNYLGTGIVGAYVQDEWQFAPQWRLNLGARIDYEFYGGFQPSGRISLSYDLSENSLLYGAVSRAFQMPPVGCRFLNVPLADGLAYVTTDSNISSEQLIAYELGYRGIFLDRIHTGVSVFCHQYDTLTGLPLRLGPPGIIQQRFSHIADAYLYGVELDTRYAVSEKLTLLGNYTFQHEDAYHGDLGSSDYILPPKHKFMVGARYTPIDPLRLSAHLYYVDHASGPNPTLPTQYTRLDIPHYFRLDLRAEYEFWKDRGTVAVGVRNLLDPHHPEGTSGFQNYAEVPRMVYAELRMTFK